MNSRNRSVVSSDAVAVLRNRPAVDQLHHQIRNTFLGGTAIEQSRYVGMSKACQYLPLRPQASGDEWRHLPRPHQLDRNLLVILLIHSGGSVYLTHAADPDLCNDLVRSDAPTDHAIHGVSESQRCRRRRPQESGARRFIGRQQRLDIRAQARIRITDAL